MNTVAVKLILLSILAFVMVSSKCPDVSEFLNKRIKSNYRACVSSFPAGSRTFYQYTLGPSSFSVNGQSIGSNRFTISNETNQVIELKPKEFDAPYNGPIVQQNSTDSFLYEVSVNNTVEAELSDTLILYFGDIFPHNYIIKPVAINNTKFRFAIKTSDETSSLKNRVNFTLIEKVGGVVVSSVNLVENDDKTYLTSLLNSETSEWALEIPASNIDIFPARYLQVDLLFETPRESEINNKPHLFAANEIFYKTVSSIRNNDEFMIDAISFEYIEAIIYENNNGSLTPITEFYPPNRIEVNMQKILAKNHIRSQLNQEYTLKIKFRAACIYQSFEFLTVISKYPVERLNQETYGYILRGNMFDNVAIFKVSADLVKDTNIAFSFFTVSDTSDNYYVKLGYDEITTIKNDDTVISQTNLSLIALQVDQVKLANSSFLYVYVKKELLSKSYLHFEIFFTKDLFLNSWISEDYNFSLTKDQSLYVIHESYNQYPYDGYKKSVTFEIESDSQDYSAFAYSLNVDFSQYRFKFSTLRSFLSFDENNQFSGLKKFDFLNKTSSYEFLKITANSDFNATLKINFDLSNKATDMEATKIKFLEE